MVITNCACCPVATPNVSATKLLLHTSSVLSPQEISILKSDARSCDPDRLSNIHVCLQVVVACSLLCVLVVCDLKLGGVFDLKHVGVN